MSEFHAVVLVANGSEDIEAVTVVDILRRGGITVTVASVESSLEVQCANHIHLKADALVQDIDPAAIHAVVLPGGMQGSRTFNDSDAVLALVSALIDQDKHVAAICAAPTFFAAHKLFTDRKITSHPCVKSEIEAVFAGKYVEAKVVVDRKFITSRGPGTAMEFALTLVEEFTTKENRAHVHAPLML